MPPTRRRSCPQPRPGAASAGPREPAGRLRRTAIDQAAAFLDDPPGIRAVLNAIDRLADDPRPAGSFPYGSPDLRRLRVGLYRILYEITDETVAIRHIARSTGN
jgi:mRNA interferase RelE/StbE